MFVFSSQTYSSKWNQLSAHTRHVVWTSDITSLHHQNVKPLQNDRSMFLRFKGTLSYIKMPLFYSLHVSDYQIPIFTCSSDVDFISYRMVPMGCLLMCIGGHVWGPKILNFMKKAENYMFWRMKLENQVVTTNWIFQFSR